MLLLTFAHEYALMGPTGVLSRSGWKVFVRSEYAHMSPNVRCRSAIPTGKEEVASAPPKRTTVMASGCPIDSQEKMKRDDGHTLCPPGTKFDQVSFSTE